MSLYVLMRLLESAPRRYDALMRVIAGRRLEAARDRLTATLRPGQRVLDVGCGTGALTLRAARRGARVKAIDVDPEMLAIARRKARDAGLDDRIVWEEKGIAELDQEPAESYDAIMSGLTFSELGPAELQYALEQVHRLLKPGGRLLVADEVRPERAPWRVLHALIRVPLALLTLALVRKTTHPLVRMPQRLTAAGFRIESCRLDPTGSFLELVACKA